MSAIPPLTKAWQTTGPLGKTLCVDVGGNQATWFVKFIQFVTSYPLNPYVVLGSSNAVTAGMDGVNRLASSSDVVRVASGSGAARFWIVIKSLVTGVSWLFHGEAGAAGNDCRVLMSASSSFTGGSTTAAPTAPDQINKGDTGSGDGGGVGANLFGSATTPLRLCVWHSEDGRQTMAVAIGDAFGGDSVSYTLLMGEAHNPRADWTVPAFFASSGTSFGGPDVSALCGSGGGFGTMAQKPGGAIASVWGCVEVYWNIGGRPTCGTNAAIDPDGRHEAEPILLHADSSDFFGPVGEWPDLLVYSSSDASQWADGSAGNFPDAGKTRVVIGRFLWPWDGDTVWVLN